MVFIALRFRYMLYLPQKRKCIFRCMDEQRDDISFNGPRSSPAEVDDDMSPFFGRITARVSPRVPYLFGDFARNLTVREPPWPLGNEIFQEPLANKFKLYILGNFYQLLVSWKSIGLLQTRIIFKAFSRFKHLSMALSTFCRFVDSFGLRTPHKTKSKTNNWNGKEDPSWSFGELHRCLEVFFLE